MTDVDTWVFGYGSLVSPSSLATTIGRVVEPADVAVAELTGFGRRWNYGAAGVRGSWADGENTVDDGVMVALGLVPADEACNGVAVRVTPDELDRLDARERHYDRTDVTECITLLPPVDGVADASPTAVRFVTYVPRADAIERYEHARDARRAAIRQDYWDLVDHAFAALGTDHLARYRRTPAPDVPVVTMTLRRD